MAECFLPAAARPAVSADMAQEAWEVARWLAARRGAAGQAAAGERAPGECAGAGDGAMVEESDAADSLREPR
jgi:hypothetical protein